MLRMPTFKGQGGCTAVPGAGQPLHKIAWSIKAALFLCIKPPSPMVHVWYILGASHRGTSLLELGLETQISGWDSISLFELSPSLCVGTVLYF